MEGHVKVDPRSTFTFTRSLLYISSISLTQVNFTCVRTKKLRDSGNQPLGWIFTDAFLATALTHVNFNHRALNRGNIKRVEIKGEV